MRENYDYGKDMVTLVTKMKNHASYILAQASRCEIIYLKDLALEPPFTDIVSRFKVPLPNVNTPVGSIPVIGPDMADKLIDFLKLIEFGAYGLAVDYSEVKYDLTVGSCGDGCGWVTDDNGDPHRVISLCDRCVDSSDLGNIMFGLGGNVRGYDMISTYFWAAMFNAARDPFDSPIEIPINAFNREDLAEHFRAGRLGLTMRILVEERFVQ